MPDDSNVSADAECLANHNAISNRNSLRNFEIESEGSVDWESADCSDSDIPQDDYLEDMLPDVIEPDYTETGENCTNQDNKWTDAGKVVNEDVSLEDHGYTV
jgi:hypothetical protein